MSRGRVVMLALLLLVTFGGGCSMLRRKPLPAVVPSAGQEEHSFALALQSLKDGKDRKARTLLEQAVAGQPLPGVTDEALFRLALLRLQDDDGEDDAPTQALLSRLKKEYPRSIWAQQATPLITYLNRVGALRENQRALNARWEQSQSQLRESQRDARVQREELKSLRERNHSLLRDNKELRKLIDSLKSLDLEIEQKVRR